MWFSLLLQSYHKLYQIDFGDNMDHEFICRCPYCGHGNELNLDDYSEYLQAEMVLKDKCELCGNPYSFDIEINVLTHSFRED